MLSNACRHLRYHLIHRDELRLCTEILGEVLNFLCKQRRTCEEQGKINNCIHHDVDTLCINILDVLIQTVLVIIDKDTRVIVSKIINIYLIGKQKIYFCNAVTVDLYSIFCTHFCQRTVFCHQICFFPSHT